MQITQNEFNVITTQLSSVEIDFDDEIKALILLSSLPESWGATVTTVSSSFGSSKLKLNEIRDLILSEDVHRRESGEASCSALNIKGRGRTSQRGQDWNRSKSKRRSKSKPLGDGCWNCGKKRHMRRDCRLPKKKTWGRSKKKILLML